MDYTKFIPSKKERKNIALGLALVAMIVLILLIVGAVKILSYAAKAAEPTPTVTTSVPVPGPTKTVTTPGPTKTVETNNIPPVCIDALDQADENQAKMLQISLAFANAVVSLTQGDYKTAAEYTKVGKKKSDQIKLDVAIYNNLRDRCRG